MGIHEIQWKKGILATGIGLGIFIAMRYLFPVLFPFFLGWLIALLVLPLARRIEKRWKIRRGIAGSILIAVFTILLFFLIWKGSGILLRQSRMLFENLGFLKEGWERVLHQGCIFLEEYTGIHASASERFVLEHLSQWGDSLREQMQPAAIGSMLRVIKGAVAFFGGLVVVFVFGSLLIKDLEEWREKMEKHRLWSHIPAVGRRIASAAGKYLKAQGLIMLLVILVCIGGLWLLKNPYFLAAGVLIGILDAFPFIGTGTVLIPWSIILVIQGEYIQAVFHFLLFVVTHLLRECLEPHVLGEGLGIHPAVMLAAVYLGIIVYGLFGFILGPFSVLLFREIWRECDAG